MNYRIFTPKIKLSELLPKEPLLGGIVIFGNTTLSTHGCIDLGELVGSEDKQRSR